MHRYKIRSYSTTCTYTARSEDLPTLIPQFINDVHHAMHLPITQSTSPHRCFHHLFNKSLFLHPLDVSKPPHNSRIYSILQLSYHPLLNSHIFITEHIHPHHSGHPSHTFHHEKIQPSSLSLIHLPRLSPIQHSRSNRPFLCSSAASPIFRSSVAGSLSRSTRQCRMNH